MPIPKQRNKIIGVVGSRRRDTTDDFVLCLAAFDRLYKPGDRIVSGGCYRGADRFIEDICKSRGLWGDLLLHLPNISIYGIPQAFFERNTRIAYDVDVLIALVASDRTGGTEDTVRKALAFGKRVYIITDDSSPLFRA